MKKKHEDMKKYRYFLKDNIRLITDFSQTDQSLGVKPPPVEKPFPIESKRIVLIKPEKWQNINETGLISAIKNRRSHRKYSNEPLSNEELSFLLWATQGVKKNLGTTVLRNVPSAGNRHPFETYLCILNVADFEPGIYRYLPLEHELLFEFGYGSRQELAEKIGIATLGQFFTGTGAVVFIWVTIPYRTEWRYGIASHKVMAIDAGHVCQNLYIACEAIGAGACAIAAYNQELMDKLIKVDGEDEFVIYLAPVGKISLSAKKY
ncbi:MAG: SagB/ThcOx family dehydrogenase [Actinobacteria bacterium]|nr:SagB/ThcOx family dehydrogenase [Actinomycetota bacterium]